MRVLGIFSLMFLMISCKKEKVENYVPQTGRFLSQIIYLTDTINDIGYVSQQYYYDSYNRLIKLETFFPANVLNNTTKFEYNSSGEIIRKDFEFNGNFASYETFDYLNHKVIRNSRFSKVNNEFKLTNYDLFTYSDNQIKRETFYQNIKLPYYNVYEYDFFNANILTRRYYSNDTLKMLFMYRYDNNINPLEKLKIPIPLNPYGFFENPSFVSQNNIIQQNNIFFTNGIIDSTLSELVNLKYQYDSLSYPKKLNRYKFEYIELK